MGTIQRLEVSDIKKVFDVDISKSKLSRIKGVVKKEEGRLYDYLIGYWKGNYYLIDGFDRFECMPFKPTERITCHVLSIESEAFLYTHILRWLLYHKGCATKDKTYCIEKVIEQLGHQAGCTHIEKETNLPESRINNFLVTDFFPKEFAEKSKLSPATLNQLSALTQLGVSKDLVLKLFHLEFDRVHLRITTTNLPIIKKIIRDDPHSFLALPIHEQLACLEPFLQFRTLLVRYARDDIQRRLQSYQKKAYEYW
ncbi:hypothetical protein MKY91_17385 [Alkalicoccobacillus gibsonii]|uniref:ParB/Sulfiredoxin domain-containing protein n=1 Tax=Alkalicoccobacillus gibsonii TaxID=79881 RepID=A0ABU9VM13_9BACI